jgi:hypothetical protein
MPAVITRTEALESGLSQGAIRHRLASGRWQRLRRGIYLTGGVGPTHREAVAAALAAFGPDAAASHQSAALLHGIDLAGRPTAVHLTRPPTCRNGRHEMPGVVERAAQLPAGHVRVVDGVRVTTPARTVVDLARHLAFEESLVSIDSALRQGLATPAEIARVLDDCSAWPRARRARTAVLHGDGRSESALESLSRGVLILARLPAPELQQIVADADGLVGRVDFLWSEAGLVGEADGRGKYDSPSTLWAEKRREDRLREAGFRVVRWGWEDVTRTRSAFVARLRRILAC